MKSEMYNRLRVKKSKIHGKGVFADARIPEGSYLGRYEGPVVSEDGTYVLWVTDEEGVERGHLGTNRLKYLNHDKQRVNAEFDGIDLYSLRDIEPGEEVVIDYGWDE